MVFIVTIIGLASMIAVWIKYRKPDSGGPPALWKAQSQLNSPGPALYSVGFAMVVVGVVASFFFG